MTPRLGILSVGVYLPELVRRNDWWPAAVVDQWRERQARSFTRAQQEPGELTTEGAQRVVQAMLELKSDPFEGSLERRVLEPGRTAADMEIAAAEDALSRAGIDRGQIDFLLVQSTTPNFVHVSNACLIHRTLGLPARCFSLATEGMCNAFLQQLALAEGLMRGGARHGLLIQSSHMSPLVQQEDPFSAWFGDGSTAVVVGPAADGYGLLGQDHLTDGSIYASVVSGVPGRRWYDEGAVRVYLESAALARRMFMMIPEQAKLLMDNALARAGHSSDDVTFWACHQGTAWLPRVTQEFIGLPRARRIDTFSWAGSLTGSNIPLVLSLGEREGQLRPGDLVGLFAGAAGMTGTGMVLRWGLG
jgi:3-oxoacyl-[acyl-carrier-protein] synthase-3